MSLEPVAADPHRTRWHAAEENAARLAEAVAVDAREWASGRRVFPLLFMGNLQDVSSQQLALQNSILLEQSNSDTFISMNT